MHGGRKQSASLSGVRYPTKESKDITGPQMSRNFPSLYDLEREGILDPLNDTDLFCLHYVYLPRLNRNLAEFVSAHNNHKISTEESNTPAQLFWANLHLTAFGEGRDSQNAFRHVNISDLISTELPHVHVPETTNPLDHSSYRELQGLVDPLSGTNGKELYRRTVDFVGRALVRNPTTS